jgi:transcriptional regulator with XRE-family HTH domain
MTKTEAKRKIGQRIIQLREKKGWTQAELARACKKDRQAIEKLENGRVNPTLYSMIEVAKALGVQLDTLVNTFKI